MTKVKMFIHF